MKRLRPKKPVLINVEGNKMYVDVHAPAELLFGTYEKPVTELFKKEIKQGMTVIDIGAHIGYYTLLAARLVGSKGKVFAFEPAPDNYALLVKNIAINGYKNVIPVQKAIWNKTDRLKLVLCSYESVAHHISVSSNVKEEIVFVDAISLDEYFKDKSTQIDFIKMDIEGAEMFALQGMSNIIKNNKNLKIITEFCPEHLRRVGSSPEEFLLKLMRAGFKVYDIYTRKYISPSESDVKSFVKSYNGKGRLTNLFCTKDN
jgi:FkbM family methyltransferase